VTTESLDVEMTLEAFAIVDQQSIYESEQLHDPLILPDVLMSLQYKRVGNAIASLKSHLTGPLFGGNDCKDVFEPQDPNDWLATLVGTRNCKIQVMGFL